MMDAAKAYNKMCQAIIDAMAEYEAGTGMIVREIGIRLVDDTRIEDYAKRVMRQLDIEVERLPEPWK